MATTWVYAEVSDGGKIEAGALELLSKARSMEGDVAAVALGPGATEAAPQLGEYGAATVYASDDPVYADFVAQPAAEALFQLQQQHSPDLILFSMTYDSRDIAGRLSAKTGSPLMSNVTDIFGATKARTAIFGGTTFVDVELQAPTLLVVRPKSFAAEASGGQAEVIPCGCRDPRLGQEGQRVERHEEEATGPKLEEAPVIIAGGRGLQGADNFKLLEELAAAIGNAAVGATRAVVTRGGCPIRCRSARPERRSSPASTSRSESAEPRNTWSA